jgi:histidinol-phosphate aminotransferase
VLQTLSKAWGLAGARVGLAFASPEIIGVMNKVKFPYNVGKPSLQIASMALLIEKSFKERVDEITTNREKLVKSLENLPIVKGVFPSEANFLLVKFDNPKEIYTYLAQNGVVVRDRSTQPGCQGCLRITVGTKEEVEKLLSCLRAMDNG